MADTAAAALDISIHALREEGDQEPDEDPAYSKMKMAELREAAAAYGVDASKIRSKKEVIAMIEAAKAKAAKEPED